MTSSHSSALEQYSASSPLHHAVLQVTTSKPFNVHMIRAALSLPAKSYRASDYAALIAESTRPRNVQGQIGVDWCPPLNYVFKLAPKRAPVLYSSAPLPAQFSWTTPSDVKQRMNRDDVDILTPPDQAKCGSCWVVSSASASSDKWAILNPGKRNPNLSPNELVVSTDGDQPCYPLASWPGSGSCGSGGWASIVGQYLKQYGLPQGNCEPYFCTPQMSPDQCAQAAASNCPASAGCCGQGASEKSMIRYFASTDPMDLTITSADEEKSGIENIKQHLYANGPLLVSMQVPNALTTYTGGVFRPTAAEMAHLLGGHAVTLVGWGSSASEGDFWVIRNSWGTQWGENGYFRVPQGYANPTGIDHSIAPYATGVTTWEMAADSKSVAQPDPKRCLRPDPGPSPGPDPNPQPIIPDPDDPIPPYNSSGGCFSGSAASAETHVGTFLMAFALATAVAASAWIGVAAIVRRR